MERHKKNIWGKLALIILLAMLASCSSKNDKLTDADAGNNSDETSASDISADNTTFSYSMDIDENGFLKGIKAQDYVEPLNYESLIIPTEVHQIPEETVQAGIAYMLEDYSTSKQTTNRAVVDGDTVNIDYVGSVDGVEFAGGSTEGRGTDVTIGVTSYIDDFLEQLIGHTPGETINVEVTFPSVYQEESLQGKDALFVTTVNYIVETVPPELTDDFVKANLSQDNGWETVDKMKEDISAEVQKANIEQYINEYLANETTVRSIPDKLAEFQEKAMLQYYKDGAVQYGMDFDDFIKSYFGVSGTEELIEMHRDLNLQNAKYTLVIQAVAEDRGISVSEEDMVNFYTDYSLYKEQYGLPYLKQIVLSQKVTDYLIDNAIFE